MSSGQVKSRVITALRIKDGLSMRQLAEKAGISAPYLSKLEASLAKGTPTVALRLANALGVPLEALWSPAGTPEVNVVVLEVTGTRDAS